MKRIGLLLTLVLAACGSPGLESTETAVPAAAGIAEAADPVLARDAATGDVLMAWVAGDGSGYDVYAARSTDAGATWSEPVRVTKERGLVQPHAEASPRMIAHNGVVALFWPTSIEVAGRRFPASHMRFSRSTDGGRTWSDPRILNDDTTAVLAGHTFHGATAVGDSTLVVAWLDSRAGVKAATDPTAHHSGDATVYAARSNDLGATWSATNTELWANACPCCRVSLAATPDGSVLAAWRGHFEGSVRDPVVARLDAAKEPPVRVHEDGWVFPGCPHSGPALAVDGRGRAHVAWFTGREGGAGVYYARMDDDAFTEPMPLLTGEALQTGHPALAILPDNSAVVAVNLDETGGRVLSLFRISADGNVTKAVVPGTEGADHPQVLGNPDGTVLVTWTDRAAGSRIRMLRVR